MFSYDLPLKVSKDSLNPNPAKVGQAVYDIMSKPQASQTVEETTEAMAERYYKELFDTVITSKKIYDDPFYIVILRKKEFWALNVLRQWYIARQTRPSPKYLREQYPNHDHDLWKVEGNDISLQWTLPTKQDADTIMQNANLYGGEIVKWISAYNDGRLA